MGDIVDASKLSLHVTSHAVRLLWSYNCMVL